MDGLRLRVLYRVFQRFAFRAVFVDLLHVRVDEREVVVVQVLIEEHLERACGGDALGALVGAGQRGAGDEPVKQHERNEQNGEDSARALRNFFNHARHGRVNFFDPDKAERAPDECEHQVCAAVNVERRAAVIPRNGAEQHLLSPTAQILERRTDDAAGNKNDDVVLLVELIQA